MPIIQTAAGPVMVEDGTPPDVIARIRAQNSKPAAAAPAAQQQQPMDADAQEVSRRVTAEKKNNATGLFGQSGADYWRRTTQGFLGNFWDEMAGAGSAATSGVKKAVQTGNIGEIGHEYRLSRDTERQLTNEAVQRTGTGGTIAEIAGALANPIGDGAALLKFGGKAIPLLAKAGTKLAAAPALVRGVAAGANQGAFNAAGSADNNDHILSTIGQGAAVGGAMGGIFGGATTGARRVVQILRDRGTDAAERVAYNRIGTMLDKGGMSPLTAQRELAVTNARGGNGMVQDLTPGLRAQAGAIARRPEVAGSNDLINGGEDRLMGRNDRFDTELKNRVGNADATAHMDQLKATRQAQGNVDYQQALDGKFHWNQPLQDFVDKADPEIHAAFRDGARLASLHDQDIGQLGMQIGADGKPIMSTTPSMRVFDYTKRAMDAKISQAYRSGDNAYAAGLSNQLGKFKQLIMDANPDYAPALAKQRDFFQRAEATQFGLGVVKRLQSDPKGVLKDIQALDPAHHDDARQGIADALINLRSQKADPSQFVRTLANRSPEARQVLEFTLGGPKSFNQFRRFLDREGRSTAADLYTAPGRQSITSHMDGAQASLGSDVGSLAENVGRGFGFGGPIGGGAAFLRKMNDFRTGMSPQALDAMAHALMTDGKTLPEKVAASAAYAIRRKAGNARWAIRAGKAAQQPMTDFAGD
jgi:hypothetical protein